MYHQPSYLKRSQHGVYYFRVRIPTCLTSAFGRQEFKRSLGTKNFNEAVGQATLLKRSFDSAIQRAFEMSRTLSTDNFNQVALELFELEMRWFYDTPGFGDCFQNDSYLEFFERIQNDMIKRTSLNAPPVPFSVFDGRSMLRELGIEQVADSTIEKRFNAVLQSIMVFWQNSQKLKLKGNIVELEDTIDKEHQKYQDRTKRISSTLISNQTVSLEQVNTANFSAVVDDYLSHLQKSKGKKAPAQSTIADYRTKLNIYTTILKNKPFYEITKQDIVNCKKITYNLPKNINKINWASTHNTFQELVDNESHGYSLIEVTTISKYLSQLKKLCQYAFENNYCTSNPAGSIKFEYTKEVQNERIPFTNSELNTIFNSYLYSAEPPPPRLKLKSYQFWLPILGAFTGARLNEICSLYLDDIKFDKETSHYYIDINQNKPDKKVKTRSGERQVPIIKTVLDIGFLDYIQELKDSGEERLFPELKYNEKEGYGKEASKWFCKLEKKGESYTKGFLALIDIKTPETPKHSKTFHCFRHTFINNLKNNTQVDLFKVSDLVGHEKGDLQTQNYGGKEYKMKIKLDTINRLNYEIDFSHIHWNNFLNPIG